MFELYKLISLLYQPRNKAGLGVGQETDGFFGRGGESEIEHERVGQEAGLAVKLMIPGAA